MKKGLIILLLFSAVTAGAQKYVDQPNYGVSYPRGAFPLALHIPNISDTNFVRDNSRWKDSAEVGIFQGELWYKPAKGFWKKAAKGDSVDLSNYFTIEEINNSFQPLGDYATHFDLSEYEQSSHAASTYITINGVDSVKNNLRNEIAGKSGNVDLTDYYNKAGVNGIRDSLKAKIDSIAITPELFGAKRDGVTDDYAAFKLAEQAAELFHKDVTLSPGTYRLDNGAGDKLARMIVAKGVSFIGHNTTIKYSYNGLPLFSFVQSNGGGFENCKFVFTGTTQHVADFTNTQITAKMGIPSFSVNPTAFWCAFFLMQSDNLTFNNLSFESATPDTAHVPSVLYTVWGNEATPGQANNLTITNQNFKHYCLGIVSTAQKGFKYKNITSEGRFNSGLLPPGHVIYMTNSNSFHQLVNADGLIDNIYDYGRELPNFDSVATGTLAVKYIRNSVISNVYSENRYGVIQSISNAQGNTFEHIVYRKLDTAATLTPAIDFAGTPDSVAFNHFHNITFISDSVFIRGFNETSGNTYGNTWDNIYYRTNFNWNTKQTFSNTGLIAAGGANVYKNVTIVPTAAMGATRFNTPFSLGATSQNSTVQAQIFGSNNPATFIISDAGTNNKIINYVTQVTGKGLSTEDYTTAEKTKLAGIATGATNVTNNNQIANGANYITSSALTGLETSSHASGTYATISSLNNFLLTTDAASIYATQSILNTNYLTKTQSDANYSPASHTHTFASLTSKPTTLAGYGITDAFTQSQADALYSPLGHIHTFASLTSKPTTLSGYGITDAYPLTGNPSGFLTSAGLSNFVDKTTSNTYTAGATQIFSANATNAGISFGGVTADPSSLSTGNFWYRTDLNKFRYYDGTTTRSLVSEQLPQTITNKTIAAGSNTITGLGASNMSLPAQSMIVNNTNATATPTTTSYMDVAEQAYSSTITFTGTTAPSGTASNTYQWTQIGKLVTLRMNFSYASAGNAITALSMPLPTDCPAPLVPSGFTGASNLLYIGNAYAQGTLNTFGAGTTARSVIRVNAASTGFEVVMATSSTAFKGGWITIQYWAQ